MNVLAVRSQTMNTHRPASPEKLEEYAMAHREVTGTEWECDACGHKEVLFPADKKLPAGWSEDVISLSSPFGGSTNGIQVCPQCTKSPEEAKRKAKEKWGQ